LKGEITVNKKQFLKYLQARYLMHKEKQTKEHKIYEKSVNPNFTMLLIETTIMNEIIEMYAGIAGMTFEEATEEIQIVTVYEE
jgi:hypothetical protein